MVEHPHRQVAVLGAGLTGALVALELARTGKSVALVEQDDVSLNRASLRNEGKIHLGFVYAADHALATARLMLEGALSFRRLLTRALRGRTGALVTSTPFVYLVADTSILTPVELSRSYHAIEGIYLDRLRHEPGADYLGRRPARLFHPVPLASLRSHFRVDRLLGAFQTQELAIDTDRLARAIRMAISEEPNIRLLAAHRVRAVERASGEFRVEGQGRLGTWRLPAEQVVNCLWDGRLCIDAQVGLEPPPGWVYRLKYRVIARLPPVLRRGPSATMVLGRFGDVVVRPDGLGYFSWYPASLRGWSHELAPPDSWDAPCRGDVARDVAQAVARQILFAVDAWYPGAGDATPVGVDAGAIVAYGQTDVDDPASGLHSRTRVGVASMDGYHTVDPGKLTTAPWFAVRAAREVSRPAAAV
jgi:glycine/D-amino acid oxidase-like deaminating enzyme